MTLNLDDIEQKAKAATPGEWFLHDFTDPKINSAPTARVVTVSCDHPATITVAEMGGGLDGHTGIEQARHDAAHIASASPATVLAMVAEIRRLEQKLETFKRLAATNNERATWLANDGLARAQENKRLREVVEQARDWFQQYADGHKAKGDTDKAQRNQDRADFCASALEERR
jgi:hypothetical protein